MEQEASLRILSRLVRIGTVMSVDKEKRMVRVKFQNEGMPSGWLYVLQHYDADLHIEPDGEHYHETNSAGGHNHPGSSVTITQDGSHTHSVESAGNHSHSATASEGGSVSVASAGDHTHSAADAGGHNHPGSSVTITQDGEHAHRTLEAYYGKERRATHSHERSFVTWWLPKIDDAVLCLCLPTDDGDGYVLGAI